jgi:hypothetical protein
LKAVLAARLSVACSAIAAGSRQNRHDIEFVRDAACNRLGGLNRGAADAETYDADGKGQTSDD